MVGKSLWWFLGGLGEATSTWVRQLHLNAEFLPLGTTVTLGGTVLHCGVILCLVGCLAASLTLSTRGQ